MCNWQKALKPLNPDPMHASATLCAIGSGVKPQASRNIANGKEFAARVPIALPSSIPYAPENHAQLVLPSTNWSHAAQKLSYHCRINPRTKSLKFVVRNGSELVMSAQVCTRVLPSGSASNVTHCSIVLPSMWSIHATCRAGEQIVIT